jgi:hypothetical protein
MAASNDISADVQPAANAEGKRKLAAWLSSKYTTYKSDRRLAEIQWMKNIRQYLGQYDEESKMSENMSRAYPKQTRVKCVSMKSRLMDLLFPASEKNWSLASSPVPSLPADTLQKLLTGWLTDHPGERPTQAVLDRLVTDRAKAVAARQEQIIDDQLKDIDPYGAVDYEALCGQVIESAVRYGPGVVKGPSLLSDSVATLTLDVTGMPQVLVVDTYRPYFEFVSCWDYFPDMTAKRFDQMDGEFQRHVKSRQQLSALAKRGDFDGDLIRDFMLRNQNGNYTKLNYENDLDAVGGQGANKLPEGNKYELLEYWGSTTAQKLREAGVDVEEADADDDVRFTAWVLGDCVVKVALNPFPYGTKMFHQFVFEEDEINLLGSGLPPIMRDSQMAIANFSRMLIDNASVVCGPNIDVNVDRLSPSMTDYTIGVNKVWLSEGNDNTPAVRSISFESHIPELISGINLFSGFADKETFVSPATGGDMESMPGEAFRTSSGASMIYGNAALPFKDIVRNFDKFTVSVIHALIQFNNLFHEEREDLAGDVRPIARGATSLMAKEMRSVAMDNLSQTMTDEDREWINTPAMLNERLKVRDLSGEDLLITQEQYDQNQQRKQQMQQEQVQQQAQMLAAQLENMRADTLKQLAQAQKNSDGADVAVFKAMVDAVEKGLNVQELTAIAQRAAGGRKSSPGQPAAANAA